MIKLINDKDAYSEAGAYIENGTIRPYKNVDLTEFMKDVRQTREAYDPSKAKNFHHIASVDADVIENIRLLRKYPNNAEGFKLAIKEVVKLVKSGELGAFRIHGA